MRLMTAARPCAVIALGLGLLAPEATIDTISPGSMSNVTSLSAETPRRPWNSLPTCSTWIINRPDYCDRDGTLSKLSPCPTSHEFKDALIFLSTGVGIFEEQP